LGSSGYMDMRRNGESLGRGALLGKAKGSGLVAAGIDRCPHWSGFTVSQNPSFKTHDSNQGTASAVPHNIARRAGFRRS
jgi:hypothetical protein